MEAPSKQSPPRMISLLPRHKKLAATIPSPSRMLPILGGLFLLMSPLVAADFSFFSIVRAGVQGAGDWEIGTGPNGNSITTGAHVTWPNNLDRNFRIGYNQSTNTAYTTVWTPSTTPGAAPIASTSSYNPLGGSPLSSSGTWTIRAGSMYASASPITPSTSVQVSNLRLGNGLNVLQPITSTSLLASQPLNAPLASNAAPIVFSTAATGGDWYIDGVVRFNGLASFTANGAQRSQLQFGLTAIASDTPEPASFLLLSCGLVTLAHWKRRRRGAHA